MIFNPSFEFFLFFSPVIVGEICLQINYSKYCTFAMDAVFSSFVRRESFECICRE